MSFFFCWSQAAVSNQRGSLASGRLETTLSAVGPGGADHLADELASAEV